MSIGEIAFLAFSGMNFVRLGSYVPQIVRIARDRDGATSISFASWSIFLLANVATAAHAIANLGDLALALVNTVNALCCLVIVTITAWKRAGHRKSRRVSQRRKAGRIFGAVLAAALGCGASVGASASEPIRIVMPFAAGSSTDAAARILSTQLQAALGRSVIVENKTGAAGRIGVQSVRTAAKDGSVLLFTPIAPMAVYPFVYDNLGYDPARDFDPVSQIATFDFGVAVAPGVSATNLSQLVDWVRTHPAQGSYGTPGAGTLPHFFAVLFGREANLDLRHVPYRGTSAAIADLLADQIPMVFGNTGELAELHRAGRLRVLATSGPARSSLLGAVPTFREQGYAISGAGWLGLFAPHGAPSAVLDELNAAIRSALRSDPVREHILRLGFEPIGTTRQELADIMARDQALWGPIVKAANFTPEQ